MLEIGCVLSCSLTDENGRLPMSDCSSSVNSESSESESNSATFVGWGGGGRGEGGMGEGEGELRESSEMVEFAIWDDEQKGV